MTRSLIACSCGWKGHKPVPKCSENIYVRPANTCDALCETQGSGRRSWFSFQRWGRAHTGFLRPHIVGRYPSTQPHFSLYYSNTSTQTAHGEDPILAHRCSPSNHTLPSQACMSSSVSSLLYRARMSDGSAPGCISFFHVPTSATPVSGRVLHAYSNFRASAMSALTCRRPATIRLLTPCITTNKSDGPGFRDVIASLEGRVHQ